MHAISGLVPIKSGEISLNGENVTNIEAHKLVNLGMAHVPEGRRIFTELTVLENLEMGAYTRNDTEQIKEDINHMFTLFPRLAERKKQLAGTMSGGEQQMLAMARVLMSSPSLLLLDEPSMGLAPLLVQEIFNIIEKINKEENVTFWNWATTCAASATPKSPPPSTKHPSAKTSPCCTTPSPATTPSRFQMTSKVV